MAARTRRQQEVLDIINRHVETNGYRPSYQQIAAFLKLRSRAGIARIIAELEQQGLLERRHQDGHFSIEVRRPGGTSVAWLDLDSIHSSTGQKPLVLPEVITGDYDSHSLRLFRVTDEAMKPEIESGDVAILEVRDYCRDDQTILAEMPDGEILLRKYYRSGTEVTLRPSNGSFQTLQLSANRVRIIGISRGLIRPVA